MSNVTENVNEGTFVFALNGLFEIYTNRLKAYDFDIAFNKTYFEQDLLSYFGKDLHEQKVGRNIKLVFSKGFQQPHFVNVNVKMILNIYTTAGSYVSRCKF